MTPKMEAYYNITIIGKTLSLSLEDLVLLQVN